MTTVNVEDTELMLMNVRGCYIDTFQLPLDRDTGVEGKAGGRFILYDDDAAHAGQIKALKAIIKLICNAHNPITVKNAEGKKEGRMLGPEAFCLRKGEHLNNPDMYPDGSWVISARRKTGMLPYVYGLNGDLLHAEQEPRIYTGCRVNAKVRLRWMDKFTTSPADGSKPENVPARVLADMIAVQFAGDDEPLSAGYVSEEDARDGFGSVTYEPKTMEEMDEGVEEGADDGF